MLPTDILRHQICCYMENGDILSLSSVDKEMNDCLGWNFLLWKDFKESNGRKNRYMHLYGSVMEYDGKLWKPRVGNLVTIELQFHPSCSYWATTTQIRVVSICNGIVTVKNQYKITTQAIGDKKGLPEVFTLNKDYRKWVSLMQKCHSQ